LLPLLAIGRSFQEKLFLQLIIGLLGSFGICATQHWKGGNPLEKENSYRAAKPVLGQFLVGILASVNPTKSEHDFVFRLWGETSGCVQTPQQINQG